MTVTVNVLSELKDGLAHWPGDMMFSTPVRGTNYYHEAVAEIAANVLWKPAQVYCAAVLVPEDDNSNDQNAVGVWIEGQQVGHLPREYAPEFRKRLLDAGFDRAVTTCDALITKGLVTEEKQYSYCVELDIGTDPAPVPELKPTWPEVRRMDPDPVFQQDADGSYTATVLLERDALADADKRLRVQSWTTDHWSTVNYYLLNRQHIGLGYRLVSIDKGRHEAMFGAQDAEVTVESIRYRMAAIRLRRVA